MRSQNGIYGETAFCVCDTRFLSKSVFVCVYVSVYICKTYIFIYKHAYACKHKSHVSAGEVCSVIVSEEL